MVRPQYKGGVKWDFFSSLLGQIHRGGDVAIPALVRYLRRASDPAVGMSDERRFAIRSLGQFKTEAKAVLPEIELYINSTGAGFQFSVDEPKNDLGDVAKEAIRRIRGESEKK